jgi:phosphate transport system substrate-binding protein
MKVARSSTVAVAVACLAALAAGCGSRRDASSEGGFSRDGKTIIRVEGSDTMVNLAQAWAEEYHKTHPDVSIQVSGGGSGVGIASLIDGMANMANSSRKMRDKELARAEQNTGQRPQEIVLAMDALAVYVHPDNPLDSISIEELAEIYGEGGEITTWKQLGVNNAACKTDEITRVSRQNNSGTYHYFREAVLGENRDYKLGSIDQSGSKDVVALVSSTPCAIGYSGMGYHTDDVKWLKVSNQKGQPGVEPSVASAADGSYPIARPLQVYTLGEPTGALKEYIDWILSAEGQQIVLVLGYVPVGDPAGAGAEASTEDAAPVAEPAAGQPEPSSAAAGGQE